MKIKYNNMVGDLVPEEYFESCRHCYFHSNQCCIPYDAWQCVNTIFAKSKSQVLEL